MTDRRPEHEGESTPGTTTPGGTFPLGETPVSRVGYGTMRLAHGASAPSRDAAVAVLREAIALGIDQLDTAAFYGRDVANALIREALSPYPDDLVIATKVGASLSPDGALVAAQRPEELRAQVEANLATLGLERIDVVNLRRCDAPPGIVATGDQLVDLDVQLAELTALRDEGKIGAIGLSAVSLDQLRVALPAGIACVQNLYSVLDRRDEPMLEVCAEHGIAWVPFFPLGGGGMPGRRSVAEDPVVSAVADRLGASPAAVAIAWLLQHAPNILVISGTTSLAHLRENVAAAELRLDDDAMRSLDGLGSVR